MSFKEASTFFQSGAITAAELVDVCIRLFGDDVAEVLPEMIALLPTIAKQHAIYDAYCACAEPIVRAVAVSQRGVERSFSTSNMPSIKRCVHACTSWHTHPHAAALTCVARAGSTACQVTRAPTPRPTAPKSSRPSPRAWHACINAQLLTCLQVVCQAARRQQQATKEGRLGITLLFHLAQFLQMPLFFAWCVVCVWCGRCAHVCRGCACFTALMTCCQKRLYLVGVPRLVLSECHNNKKVFAQSRLQTHARHRAAAVSPRGRGTVPPRQGPPAPVRARLACPH